MSYSPGNSHIPPKGKFGKSSTQNGTFQDGFLLNLRGPKLIPLELERLRPRLSEMQWDGWQSYIPGMQISENI